MKLNKVLPYKLARVLPILGIAGASLFAGCSKEDEPTRDVEVTLIKDYAAQPDIRTIYLVPLDNWKNFGSQAITGLRKNALEYAINYSPKVRGRGDFNFWPGAASLVPEDSLWYVQ